VGFSAIFVLLFVVSARTLPSSQVLAKLVAGLRCDDAQLLDLGLIDVGVVCSAEIG
jgi:hypothetical protein